MVKEMGRRAMRGLTRTALALVLATASCDGTGYTITSDDAGTEDPRWDDPATTGPISLRWSWMIQGRASHEVDFDALCAWAGWGPSTVRLLVDADFDTTEDYFYEANCEWGTAETDPGSDPAGYEPGDVIWYAFQLLGSDGTVIAQSTNYIEVTLHAGTNDLGVVDFELGDYGPLDVLVQWEGGEDDRTFGDCGFPIDPVAIMGYLLTTSTGEVADEVDIDVAPMDCTTWLSWLLLEYRTYDLLIDGENAEGWTIWGSMCVDLIVDDPHSNEWQCDVLMTAYP
jgi:hypothetical protein